MTKKHFPRRVAKQESRWQRKFEEEAQAAVTGRPPQVVFITIEGAIGNLLRGPVTTTARGLEYAVAWFRDRGYNLKHHQQGIGAHPWTAVFERDS